MSANDLNRKLNEDKPLQNIKRFLNLVIVIIAIIIMIILSNQHSIIQWFRTNNKKPAKDSTLNSANKLIDNKKTINYWIAPSVTNINDSNNKKIVVYGKELIAHTSTYYGPKGTIKKMSNGMNCQNCHLNAGTVIYGNNYSAVASTYPKFRARSGGVESIEKRVNDCFERSLNGVSIDSACKEMKAIVAYIKFIGSNVPKNQKPTGAGFKEMDFLSRAANPVNGKNIYITKCQSCHQENGSGVLNETQTEYIYPPLWGNHSFNDAAGLFRISNFAKYIKFNMPQGVTYASPQLSDEEAWDVSAYVLNQKRTHINKPKDWPDISKKPIDLPFKPYVDNFSEQQHKFGPFLPIVEANKKMK